MRRIVITTHSWSSLSVRSRKKDSEFQTIIYFTLIVVSLFICQIFSSKLKRKLVTFSIYMRKMCPNLHTFLPYWKIINLWVEARRIIANFSSPHAAKSRFLLSSFLLYIFKNLISHLDWTKYFRKRFLKEIGYSRSFVATKSFFQCKIEKSNSKRHLPILFPNSYIWYQNKIIRLWWGPKLYLGFEGSPQSHFDIKERWHCYLRLEIPGSEGERDKNSGHKKCATDILWHSVASQGGIFLDNPFFLASWIRQRLGSKEWENRGGYFSCNSSGRGY